MHPRVSEIYLVHARIIFHLIHLGSVNMSDFFDSPWLKKYLTLSCFATYHVGVILAASAALPPLSSQFPTFSGRATPATKKSGESVPG